MSSCGMYPSSNDGSLAKTSYSGGAMQHYLLLAQTDLTEAGLEPTALSV